MWEVLFVLCTINNSCIERRIAVAQEHPITVYECTVIAQAEIALVCERFPGYGLKHWRCGRPTKDT
jgi:hypothetical protein